MLQRTLHRRLRPFKEVTKHVGVKRQIRRIAEPLDFVEAQNPKVDLNYFTFSIPMRRSDEEKMERLAELVDTISAIEDSDVILLGCGFPPLSKLDHDGSKGATNGRNGRVIGADKAAIRKQFRFELSISSLVKGVSLQALPFMFLQEGYTTPAWHVRELRRDHFI